MGEHSKHDPLESEFEPAYLVEIFVNVLLAAARWWSDKALDTPVVHDGAPVVPTRELENAFTCLNIVNDLIYLLPEDEDKITNQESVTQELNRCVTVLGSVESMSETVQELSLKNQLSTL